MFETTVKVRDTGLFERKEKGETLIQRRANAERQLKPAGVTAEAERIQINPDGGFSGWDSCCDEHVLYLRPMDALGDVVEYLKIKDTEDPDAFNVLHGAIFLNDYLNSERALDELFKGFGYSSFAAYRMENGPDKQLLAMYIAESFDEDGQFMMTKAEAEKLCFSLTHMEVIL